MSFKAYLVVDAGEKGKKTFGTLENMGDYQPTGTEIDVKLKIVTHPHHISFVAIEWLVNWTDGARKKLLRSAQKLFVTAANVKQEISVQCFDVSSSLTNVAKLLCLSEERPQSWVAETKKIHLVTIQYEAKPLLANNFLTTAQCGTHAANLDTVKQ
jgi:hypothetical protein